MLRHNSVHDLCKTASVPRLRPRSEQHPDCSRRGIIAGIATISDADVLGCGAPSFRVQRRRLGPDDGGRGAASVSISEVVDTQGITEDPM